MRNQSRPLTLTLSPRDRKVALCVTQKAAFGGGVGRGNYSASQQRVAHAREDVVGAAAEKSVPLGLIDVLERGREIAGRIGEALEMREIGGEDDHVLRQILHDALQRLVVPAAERRRAHMLREILTGLLRVLPFADEELGRGR